MKEKELEQMDKEELLGIIKAQRFEIEKLNNIINELEKTLLEWHEYWEDVDDYKFEYKNAYDYLQELKENKQ